jgi:hypothetical protein
LENWSPKLQLWVFFGVQRFGCFLESNALGVFWSPKLQLWVFFGVQRFMEIFWSPTLTLEQFFFQKPSFCQKLGFFSVIESIIYLKIELNEADVDFD